MNSGPLGKDWFGDCQDVLGKMMQFCTLVWFEMILWAIAAVNIYWKGLMEWSSVGWVGAVLCLWCSKRFEKWQWLEKGGEAHENRFPVFMALLEYIMSKELGIPSFNSREELSHPAFIIFSIRNFEFCYKMEKKKNLRIFTNLIICRNLFCKVSVQFSSVTQLCLTLFNPTDYSTPGLPVHHQLLELTQTHVHWVSDAIQPAHSLSFPSIPAFSLSQHQGLFQGVSSSYQVAKVLEFQFQHQPFQWIFRTDFL